MAKYEINGKEIELETEKKFMDFYWDGADGTIIQIDLEGMLGEIQSGELQVNEELREYMRYLRRWETDAPRKRSLRELRLKGYTVVTSDALFEEDGGQEIIDNLQNSGVFAAYFLREVYGEK